MARIVTILSVLATIISIISAGLLFDQTQKTDRKLEQLKADLNKISEPTPADQIHNPEEASSSSATLSQIKVGLRNGTKVVGLTGRYEQDIKKYLEEAVITSKENASKNDYDRTIVIALNESVRERARTLAKDLKASLESLPAGEDKPEDADILIIVGKDKS